MKKIKFDHEQEMEVREDFEKALRSMQGIPSEIKLSTHNLSKVLPDEEKATVVFENDAYKKMNALVDNAKKEIGWYGCVERSETEERTFVVKKIIVFPQTVTGSTVKTDDLKFIEWQDSLSDEDFNSCRFYGHSHVDFSVSPSSVDDTFFNSTLQNVPDFYIFGIFNKKREHWLNIYDIENNILYENTDIKYMYYITDDDEWAKKQIEDNVTEQTYNYPAKSWNKTEKKVEKEEDNKSKQPLDTWGYWEKRWNSNYGYDYYD